SAVTESGSPPLAVSRTGPPDAPAAAAAGSALPISGLDTYATGTPGANVATLISTAVAATSLPAYRVSGTVADAAEDARSDATRAAASPTTGTRRAAARTGTNVGISGAPSCGKPDVT